MTRVNGETCVVLHTRPYRENSLLLSVFSLEHGRVSLVARGARGGRRGRTLQSFALIRAGWTGRSSLATLSAYEVEKQFWFKGDALAAGFYVVELLMRLMGERQSHARLFTVLCWTLENLEQDLEAVLRTFEKVLLEELGYAVDFFKEAMTGRSIEAGKHYRFDPQLGFSESGSAKGYLGATLLAIGRNEFDQMAVRRAAKRVFNQALSVHLGPAPLLSRRLLSGVRGRQGSLAAATTAAQ